MKHFKYLIFKANQQKFAVRTSIVFNLIENAKLLNNSSEIPYYKALFSFRGMIIPLLDMRKLLDLSFDSESMNSCVLIVELKINESFELVGVPIDEVLEIAENDEMIRFGNPSILEKYSEISYSTSLNCGEIVPVINLNEIIKKKFLFKQSVLNPFSRILIN
jgi:chemotaxis signal transduction protein